jgi:hypothetical protein
MFGNRICVWKPTDNNNIQVGISKNCTLKISSDAKENNKLAILQF